MTTTSEQTHGAAFAELVQLQQREEEARVRIAEVARAARAAAAELAQSREALTEAERHGATAARRRRARDESLLQRGGEQPPELRIEHTTKMTA